MTEKQKMLAGEMYNPSDPELTKERQTVRLLFQEFNSLNENQAEKEILFYIKYSKTLMKTSM